MEDEAIERSIRFLIRELLRVNQNLLQVRAALLALKTTVAGLTGEGLQEVLAQFQTAEQQILDATPDALKTKELSELLDLWEKHPPKPIADS